MDELPFYRREALDALRAPIEEGIVRIARAGGVISYPCRFSFVAAMNPCPCGFLGDGSRGCNCSEDSLRRYRSKLSGPLVDRIDIQIEIKRLNRAELMSSPTGERSAEIRERVERARLLQTVRYGSSLITNASVPAKRLEEVTELSGGGRQFVGAAIDELSMSARGLVRLLRVARTLADLEGSEQVSDHHLEEALIHRLCDVREEVSA